MPLSTRFRRFFKIDPAMIPSPPTIHSVHRFRCDAAEEEKQRTNSGAQTTGVAKEEEGNGGDAGSA
jgi:hypothetical protein